MSGPSGHMALSVFEGMFLHALKLDDDFRRDLKACGYNVANPAPSYPLAVWMACLGVAARRVYPSLEATEAMRRLGMRFLEGFFNTATGKFISLMLPMIGPAGLAKRLPKFWATGSYTSTIRSREIGPGDWELTVSDPQPRPEFENGMLTVAFEKSGVEVRLEEEQRRADGYTIRARWTE